MSEENEVTESSTPLVPVEVLDGLMAQVEVEGAELLGPDGLLSQVTKAVLERVLDEELTDHLGYDKHDPVGRGSGNSRNGTSPKVLLTEIGAVDVDVPRDRNGDFEPKLVPKHARRLDGFNDIVLSLVSRGMTTRDVRSHLVDAYKVDVSPELISKITDAVLPELREWQSRPLDDMYPILYLDAIVVKVRTDGRVTNRPVYIAMAVDLEGAKHVLGLWFGVGDEGAKYWLGILTELRNPGVTDILIACCDGLTGFADAIEAVWPQTVVQTCVVHLIRHSIRFCSWKDRRKGVKDLKPIYTAPTVEAAGVALDDFDTEWGDTYAAIVDLWRRNWDRFIPFLDFDPTIRKIIYTTNAIESLNMSLRKIIKNRGHFPNEEAATKLLYLALRNVAKKWTMPARTWKAAMNQFAILFADSFPKQ